jgi:hypothetical protein
METPLTKSNRQNRTGGVAQMIECLPSKCKALSSNSSTAKKERKKTNKINEQTLQ